MAPKRSAPASKAAKAAIKRARAVEGASCSDDDNDDYIDGPSMDSGLVYILTRRGTQAS